MSDYSYTTSSNSHCHSFSHSNEWTSSSFDSRRKVSQDIIHDRLETCRSSDHRRDRDKKLSCDSMLTSLPPVPSPPSVPFDLPLHPHGVSPVARHAPVRGHTMQSTTPSAKVSFNHYDYTKSSTSHRIRRVSHSSISPSRLPHAYPPQSPPRSGTRDRSPYQDSYISIRALSPTRSPLTSISSHGYDAPRRSMKPRRNSSRSSRSSRSIKGSPKQKRFCYPPSGFSLQSMITREHALELLANGALEFKGRTKENSHSQNYAQRFYGGIFKSDVCVADDEVCYDVVSTKASSMTIESLQQGWPLDMSLEYPNMLSAYGRSPGTTTLNWYIGLRSCDKPVCEYKESKIRKRRMKLVTILERLSYIKAHEVCDPPEQMCSFLYDNILEDPDRHSNPRYENHLQIIDLIHVLMSREWIDFSLAKNQIVSRFFHLSDEKNKTRFFHQLLLAAELYTRIQLPNHATKAGIQFLEMIPSKVRWDIALVQRWLDNMQMKPLELSDEHYQFELKLAQKSRQIHALRNFARMLKWPNLEEIEYVLKHADSKDNSIEERSIHTMSWFSGVILPGQTLPFLIMNSLIDCDKHTNSMLGHLTHIKPNCGFQYRANTYWSYRCILGKVLGASRGVRQLGGWIGPCHYAPDLERTQCLLVRTGTNRVDKPGRAISRDDVERMNSRSHPLGPVYHIDDGEKFDESIMMGDYSLPTAPEPSVDSADVIIRIQKLRFLPVEAKDGSSTKRSSGTQQYDAHVVFAFAGKNVSMSLRYDVDFICAPACVNGPHALWKGYKTQTVKVEEGLHKLPGWGSVFKGASKHAMPADPSMTLARRLPVKERSGGPYSDDDRSGNRCKSALNGIIPLPRSPRRRALLPMAPEPPSGVRGHESTLVTYIDDSDDLAFTPAKPPSAYEAEVKNPMILSVNDQKETILLIDATGVSDNEVFARAWCAHWGANAIIADVRDTCIACAVREARAAMVEVLILTQRGRDAEKDQGVCDLASNAV